MIHCYYIEFKDKAEQVKTEHALYAAGAPFIDAGKITDVSLEEFDKSRLTSPILDPLR